MGKIGFDPRQRENKYFFQFFIFKKIKKKFFFIHKFMQKKF